jgi:phenylacetate-CoA ligase
MALPDWRRPLLAAGLRLANPATARELAVLHRIEFDAAAARALHEERLTALLRHAWATTDYYRRVLAEAGAVRDGGATVDLSRFGEIPFLTKDILRDEADRLTSRALPRGRRAYANASGGSTGQPARFLQDNVYWDVNVATKTFHFGWFGKRLGDRELKVWGSEHDLIKGREGLVPRAKSWLYNRRSEQCFVLPEERVREIVGTINRFRPRLIWAYRDGIDVVAQHVNRHGIAVHRPAAVFVGGGTIYPYIVEQVGRAFGAPVVNHYGSREMGDVACQCPELRGLHVSTNSHKVEVVDPEGRPVVDGEGELAITSLHNHAMPLIRYRIGDRAAALSAPCPCGRAFPTLGAVSGRVIERLVNARGESVDAIYLIHLVGVVANEGFVRRFQVVQEAPDRLVVNMILEAGVAPEAVAAKLDAIGAKIRLVMGAACRVDHRFVADIPLTRSGKHPYVVRGAPVGGPAPAEAAA